MGTRRILVDFSVTSLDPKIRLNKVPVGVSAEKLLLGAFSGTKLDVPRLAAARGRARGRARASLRSLSFVN